MKEEQLYFIAIMLPRAVDEEIIQFKNEMAQQYNSKKALRTASHITLKAPFKIPASQQIAVMQWFSAMTITVAPFIQEIKDFGTFSNKRNPVIYVQPVMNPSLQQLQQEVVQQFKKEHPGENISNNEYHFSPHITIGYRDLQVHFFKEAWEVYKSKQYTAAFEVSSFQLLQHIGGRWQVAGNFSLPQPG